MSSFDGSAELAEVKLRMTPALRAGCRARGYPLDTPEREGCYREAARRYREEISLSLRLVGGIRSFEVAEQLVEEGATGYLSLCRPLICEPDLINRWKAGDTRRSECISDNGCKWVHRSPRRREGGALPSYWHPVDHRVAGLRWPE